jgi:6-phosphogluconolactonase
LLHLPTLRVVPTDAVSATAAEVIAEGLAAAVGTLGVAHWATTGGSAAPGIYRALATSPLRDRVAWDRVHTWWGDDRWVPYDDPESNVRPLREDLLGGLSIPGDHLHPWPIPEAIAAGEGPDWVAARYAEALTATVPLDASGTPVLDLVVLGVGPDGHILSVFPDSAVWEAEGCCAAVPAPTHVGPHLDRVTLHPRLVAAARSVLVVTAGMSKAANLGRAWSGHDLRELPVRAARLPTATWVLDEAAASMIPRA